MPGDHARVMAVIDDWWGGRSMSAMLPRLFVEHFRDTSVIVETGEGDLVAFLFAFVSPSKPQTGYIHFVGVAPSQRQAGLGREIYGWAFDALALRGCTRVEAVTAVTNTASQAFHRAMGFAVSEPIAGYDGPGEDRVVLSRHL